MAEDLVQEVLLVVYLKASGAAMPAATPAFEFGRWITFLNSDEQELMRLRFIEQWEYHEIAAAHAVPIGTVLWRVFNAQKKLAPYLKTGLNDNRKAADPPRKVRQLAA